MSSLIRTTVAQRSVIRRALISPRLSFGAIETPRRSVSTVHSVAQPSFWASLVPKPLRSPSRAATKAKDPKKRKTNPATFYIVIFLLIGSMSIQMIALKNEHSAFTRRTDAKIALLREVIQKVQNGEEVDVEGLLGTGDPVKEQEWEEVIREIQQEDAILEQTNRKRSSRRAAQTESTPDTNETNQDHRTAAEPSENQTPKFRSTAPRGFY